MFVEFLIVFLIFLTIVLGMVQLAFLYVGRAVTQRAANAATRAAVVVLDDDPRCYGAPRNVAAGRRLEDIRLAARVPLSSLSAHGATVEDAIGRGLGGHGAGLAYAGDALRVSFPNGSPGLESDVTVRVAFEFSCGVPLGRFVLCGADAALTLQAEATLPNQGARYDYAGPARCAPRGPR